MATTWIERILDKFFEIIFGPPYEEKETLIFETAKEFFEKLKANEAYLTIVKDPYKLAFPDHVLLWFDDEKITFQIYLPLDSIVWQIIKNKLNELEIYFPNDDGLWAQTLPYEEMEKLLPVPDST